MRHEVTIICDDIRQEIGNKISLMGLYDDAVVVKRFPARLPKICIFQRWGDAKLGRRERIRVELVGSPLSQPVSANCEPDQKHFSEAATKAQVLLSLAPFDLIKTGEIEFVTYFGESREAAHRHRIEIRSDPDLDV